MRDFTPIAHVGDAPSIMLVPNSSPAKTVREWIDYAKKNPGKLNYASSGNGTIVQLTAELFKSQAGVFVTHIPYKGTALAIPDLISGKVDVLFDSLPTGMPHVRDGRLRALGVTTLKRSPLAPELPAIADALPGFESNTWFGLYGPKGLPADMVARINTAANEALADPEVRDKLAQAGHRADDQHAGAVREHGGAGRRQVEEDHHRTQDHRATEPHEIRLRTTPTPRPASRSSRATSSRPRIRWPRRPACACCSRAAMRSMRRSPPRP